jgi:uncharacterized protein with von Willebrand factor type A (vWA) domain
VSTLAFDASSLEERYAFLDACPEPFFAKVVTLPIGTLPERVWGLLEWRSALLEGQLPPSATWPPHEIAAPARQALTSMGLLRFCKGQIELVDAILHDVLASFAGHSAAFRDEVTARLEELERLARQRLEEEERDRARRERRAARPVALDEDTRAWLAEQAMREARTRSLSDDPTLIATWGERVRAWSEIAEVFGDLGQMMGRGWDFCRGVLKHVGWSDLVRLRQLVEALPQLREVVQSLGRLHASEDAESIAETVFVPVRRLEEERHETRVPNLPQEMRGIERSGDIARMLPGEAALLGHPQLRKLWLARWAERALLTYRVEGTLVERRLVEREHLEAVVEKRPRPERGPILAVIDTSGSMHGLPERVAKAVVFEALRTAHEEKRRCVLYLYSGPGQVEELELDLSSAGIETLLNFLGLSFGGGNDEVGVLSRVLQRLEENEWQKADVLLVSDGVWPTPSGVVQGVARARERGTRFHGVQVGTSGPSGLHAVCDPVHVFTNWAALGGRHR